MTERINNHQKETFLGIYNNKECEYIRSQKCEKKINIQSQTHTHTHTYRHKNTSVHLFSTT